MFFYAYLQKNRIVFLKKIITYGLLFLLIFVSNCKAISDCLHLCDDSIVFSQEIDCEKEKSESEKSDEKDEEKNFSEYLFSCKEYSIAIANSLMFTRKTNQIFTTSDFSNTIYCPPDRFFI